MPFKFEKLLVWQKAPDLATEIDAITKNFPKEELYVLVSQIKRAADSVSLKTFRKAQQADRMQNSKDFSRLHCDRILKL